jgi:hypothetical protein
MRARNGLHSAIAFLRAHIVPDSPAEALLSSIEATHRSVAESRGIPEGPHPWVLFRAYMQALTDRYGRDDSLCKEDYQRKFKSTTDESVAFDHADRMGILEPIAAHLLSLGMEQRTTEEELTSWFIEGTLHEEDAMLVCKPYIIKKGNNEPNIGGWRELATSIRSLWKDRQRREGTDHQPMVSAKAHVAVVKPAIACYICGGSHFSKECQAST